MSASPERAGARALLARSLEAAGTERIVVMMCRDSCQDSACSVSDNTDPEDVEDAGSSASSSHYSDADYFLLEDACLLEAVRTCDVEYSAVWLACGADVNCQRQCMDQDGYEYCESPLFLAMERLTIPESDDDQDTAAALQDLVYMILACRAIIEGEERPDFKGTKVFKWISTILSTAGDAERCARL